MKERKLEATEVVAGKLSREEHKQYSQKPCSSSLIVGGLALVYEQPTTNDTSNTSGTVNTRSASPTC